MIEVVLAVADYGDRAHANVLVELLDAYARDPTGGGTPSGFLDLRRWPLVNVHDVVVLESHRGRRIVQRMLERVQQEARARGACKLTLEVLSGNAAALRAYEREGFAGYQLDPAFGTGLFLQKTL